LRFEEAKDTAISQLQTLYDKALLDVGEVNAAIFEVHQMMVEDLDYVESIQNIISTSEVNAEYAIGMTADNFSAMFEAMDDAYMQGRAADVRDVSERLIRILDGSEDIENGNTMKEPSIILADDLAPSETIQMDKSMVLGFLMRNGSVNSHTAILARSMGIPALMSVGEELRDDFSGKLAIIDGLTGNVYIEPDEETLSQKKEQKQELENRKELLLNLKGKEDITIDGRRINVYANIGSIGDLGLAMGNDAGGIGLFRSEFLYLENDDFPTEEQQYQAYKQAAEIMAGKLVVIRTLDIGADKQADYFHLDPEENPALGYRAIRICLTRPEIFKVQLRALYRAAVHGNIAIMYPMITSVEEVKKIKEVEKMVKEELKRDCIPFKEDISTGIMIETPAAALVSDELAKEVDFFSVGTNDLTQYTLAIDRQNQKLEPFYNPHHKGILKLIQMAADNIHKEGKWIGICGELGADLELTETFIRMGIDELSVSPAMVLEVRNKIRNLNLQ
ncbi:phosphoenolpyruvate--protein phosphotransferase, partial [Lachnospiraceae bacterium OttesenSCG-928-D06]|nr:phosphoenolpyruvate--protein phosphotransferase [Lachnospiraceae bacterium OttesenSCG-928-D06]